MKLRPLLLTSTLMLVVLAALSEIDWGFNALRLYMAARQPLEVGESPHDVGILAQRLGVFLVVGQMPKPRAQRLDRQHRRLVEEHRSARRDRPVLQQTDHGGRVHSLSTKVLSNQ